MKTWTLYTLFLLGSFFYLSPSQSQATTLPDCPESVCSDIIHNKILGKATVVVWEGRGNILDTHTFDLDRSAVLVSTSDDVGYIDGYITASSTAPSAPCQTGSCSVPVSNTYQTTTQIVTVTSTSVYFDGELIDVQTSTSRLDLPPSEIER